MDRRGVGVDWRNGRLTVIKGERCTYGSTQTGCYWSGR